MTVARVRPRSNKTANLGEVRTDQTFREAELRGLVRDVMPDPAEIESPVVVPDRTPPRRRLARRAVFIVFAALALAMPELIFPFALFLTLTLGITALVSFCGDRLISAGATIAHQIGGQDTDRAARAASIASAAADRLPEGWARALGLSTAPEPEPGPARSAKEDRFGRIGAKLHAP